MRQLLEVIVNDPGGFVGQHIAQGAFYAEVGTKLIIAYCASACLMMVAQVPKENVCVRPDAWFGYHTLAAHLNEHGVCCTESTQTMQWLRGREWAKANGYALCK